MYAKMHTMARLLGVAGRADGPRSLTLNLSTSSEKRVRKPLPVDEVRLEDPDFYFEGRRESYERLHAECPVFYYEPLDVFVLTKHEDIRQAARRPGVFSSLRGLPLHQLRLTPEETEVYATLYGSGEQFAYADPPRHRELRGVATRNFAPRPLARLGWQVRRDVTDLTSKIEP